MGSNNLTIIIIFLNRDIQKLYIRARICCFSDAFLSFYDLTMLAFSIFPGFPRSTHLHSYSGLNTDLDISQAVPFHSRKFKAVTEQMIYSTLLHTPGKVTRLRSTSTMCTVWCWAPLHALPLHTQWYTIT